MTWVILIFMCVITPNGLNVGTDFTGVPEVREKYLTSMALWTPTEETTSYTTYIARRQFSSELIEYSAEHGDDSSARPDAQQMAQNILFVHSTGKARSNSSLNSVTTPQSTLSEEQYKVGNDILTFASYFILAIAIPFNVLNIAVFLQPGMRSSTHVYVLGMSVMQVFYLFTNFAWELLLAKTPDVNRSFAYKAYANYGMNIFLPVIQRGTYIVTCLLSAERLYAIVRPLHVKRSLLARYPTCFTCAAYSMMLLYHIFKFFKINIVEVSDTVNGSDTIYLLERTALFYSYESVFIGLEYSSKIAFSYLPLVLLIILNALTMIHLRHYIFKRRTLGHTLSSLGDVRSKKERQTTVIIMTAAVSFVLLSLPVTFQSLFSTTDSYFFGPWVGDKRVFLLVHKGTHICSLLTSVTDFLTFVTLSISYRVTLSRILCKKWPRKFHTRSKSSENNIAVSAIT